jgi:hypothetical protein
MPDLTDIGAAKAWLNIDPTDTTRDELLQSLVTAASEEAIKVMGRDPARRARSVIVDGYGGTALPMNHFPISAVESVTINPQNGAQPLPASDYFFDDNLIYLRHGTFPLGKRNVGISYTAGLAFVPASIQLAVHYTIKAFWDARLTDMNSVAESFEGVGGAGFWPSGPGAVPPQAVNLLMRFYNPVRV